MSEALLSIFRPIQKEVSLDQRGSVPQRQFPVPRKREATDPRARFLQIKALYDRFNERSTRGRKTK